MPKLNSGDDAPPGTVPEGIRARVLVCHGPDQLIDVIGHALARSAWLLVEPHPDDVFWVFVKPEHFASCLDVLLNKRGL